MNVLTGSKHWWNKQGTPIIVFSRELEAKWIWKSLL